MFVCFSRSLHPCILVKLELTRLVPLFLPNSDQFTLYNGTTILYDRKFFVEGELVLLEDWAVKENIVNLLANTTAYCLNGTTGSW
jgi:hypothetical protein